MQSPKKDMKDGLSMNDTYIQKTLRRGISGFGVVGDAKAEALLSRILAEVSFEDADEGRDIDDEELEMLAAAGVPELAFDPEKVQS